MQLNTRWNLATLAAAVGLALGSATTFAQSQNDQPKQQQSQEQSQQEGLSQQSAQSQNGRQAFGELAENHSNLSTFAHAIETAGLEDSLADGTNYTIFAPTNDAFESMSGKSTDELMEPENRDELVSLLRAHIVADDVSPQQAKQLDQARTIDGGTVDIQNKDGDLMVGDAKVTDSQGIDVSNSVRVYPIDAVLASNPGTPSSPQARSEERERG